MIRRVLLALALALVLSPNGLAQAAPDHTFQIRNGQVYFDGAHVPDAVPAGLDLAGVATDLLEIYGDVVPVLEVDGVAYVFEDRRLVPVHESTRSRGLYILPELAVAAGADRMTSTAEGAYFREVAARNEELYSRMQREHLMEVEAAALADRIRSLAPGAPRRALEEELRGRLSDLLTMKQEILSEEILFLQARLDALRARRDQRDARHDEIVDLRLSRLTTPPQ